MIDGDLPPLRIHYDRWRRVGPPSPTIKLLPDHPCPVCREALGTHRRCVGCSILIGEGHSIAWMSGETCDDCRHVAELRGDADA